ncbi:MAG TPA: septum formation initiator family protein [Candidatus Acidoferrales bacterium]|nr:septum formation initiator family protein [Candidatus Acidoferrales bacterium]
MANAKTFFRRNARYFVALAFFLLLLQDVFGAHGLLAMRREKNKINQVQAENQKLSQENQDLSQHIQKLKTDPSAIEQIARDRMGLARPGELIFRMPDLKKDDKNGTQRQPTRQKPQDQPKN